MRAVRGVELIRFSAAAIPHWLAAVNFLTRIMIAENGSLSRPQTKNNHSSFPMQVQEFSLIFISISLWHRYF